MSTRSLCLLLSILLVTLVSACGGGGLPNALTECPDGSTVTWAQAGPIFEAQCTSCHSVDKTGAQRSGAKEAVDYDDADLAFNSAGTTAEGSWYRIYDGTMPPGDDTVPEADALIIHEWFSCGGPQ
jgi:hypothetical protein